MTQQDYTSNESQLHDRAQHHTHPAQRGEMAVPITDPTLSHDIGAAIEANGATAIGYLLKVRARIGNAAEAFDVYKKVIVKRFQQQGDVMIHRGDLDASTEKREAFCAYIALNNELTTRLCERLSSFIDSMYELEFRQMTANAETMVKEEKFVEEKRDAGLIKEEHLREMKARAEQTRGIKNRIILRYVENFVQELDRQIERTIRSWAESQSAHDR